MRFTTLFEDDDAVSPVIGVILMVAITVILAAVIGTFVLGLGDQVRETPQVQFTFDEPGDANVTVTHDGGNPVETDNINVTVSSNTAVTCDSQGTELDAWPNTEITAGDQCEVDLTSGESGTLRVTWEADDGSNSGTLAKYDYDL